MSYHSWIDAVQSVKPLEVLVEATKSEIQNKLVAAGMEKMTNSGRVGNPNKLSDAQFTALIKSTFGSTQVTKFGPLEGPNTSKSYSQFMFDYEGKPDNYIVLAGGVKGRGTKQTNEQETSWLLVLSAFYDCGQNQPVDASELFDLCMKKEVYEKVYGNDGKALDEGKARGLVQWMEKNEAWVNSHIAQSKAFVNTCANSPSKFIKDRPNIPVVQLAKKIFTTSVPDQTFDKDKWNPADVWLEFSDYTGTEFETLTDLNNYLLDSISGSKGIIGVSLKLGRGVIDKINMKERPKYEVTDFDMHFGDFFSQNVSSKYGGNQLEGYSVTYRLFDAKATSTIRGEAQKKKSLAAHGKVFLKYIDFLMGFYSKRGTSAVRAVEGVKGILIKQKAGTPSGWELTKQGTKAFRTIKRVWPSLRDSDIMKYGRAGKLEEYEILSDESKFLDAVGEYARKNKTMEKEMQTRISARFQTIRLGAIFAAIKRKDTEVLHKVALGMLLYGKSESEWSAPHTKAQ